MRFSSSLMALTLASCAVAGTIPMVKRSDQTVTSDEGTAVITVADVTVIEDAEGIDRGTRIADAVIAVVNAVLSIVGGIADDINARKRFTQETVARVRQETGLNVVMSNVGYQFAGTPVSVTSTSYNAKIGADVSFDVVTFEAGTFDLKGNGGFQNWAFIVDGTCTADAKAKHIVC